MRRYRHPSFKAAPWPGLVAECHERTGLRSDYAALRAVAAAIADSPAAGLLAGQLSLEALMVTPLPMADPPDELVVVSLLPYRGEDGESDWVGVEHRTATGRDDRISRPAAQVLPLFWRFTIEKFGIHPEPSR